MAEDRGQDPVQGFGPVLREETRVTHGRNRHGQPSWGLRVSHTAEVTLLRVSHTAEGDTDEGDTAEGTHAAEGVRHTAEGVTHC